MSPVTLTKDLEQKARVFSLVGDPTRIRILQLLARGSRVNVSDIADEISMGIACVSHHLQLLRDNKLVEAKRSGNNIYYQLARNPFIKELISLI